MTTRIFWLLLMILFERCKYIFWGWRTKYWITLKCLQLDNRGKYPSKEFDVYCRRHDIWHEKIVSCTPQHNEVFKRMNCTIMEKVESMMNMAKLPKPFWEKLLILSITWLIDHHLCHWNLRFQKKCGMVRIPHILT